MGNCCQAITKSKQFEQDNATENFVISPKPLSVEERRAKAAEAAEKRQLDWRQGGTVSTDPVLQQQAKDRREKDILLGRIDAYYRTKGQDPPIGLATCDVNVLRQHLTKIGLTSV